MNFSPLMVKFESGCSLIAWTFFSCCWSFQLSVMPNACVRIFFTQTLHHWNSTPGATLKRVLSQFLERRMEAQTIPYLRTNTM